MAEEPPPDSFAPQLAAIVPPRPAGLGVDHARRALRARLFGDAAPATALGAYTIAGSLGHGGMGTVHEGRAPDGRRVALKTLRRPDPSAIHRLKHEFRCVADLGHANVAAVHELAFDAARGEWFIAMEHVPGVRWSEHVRPGDALAPEAVVRDALGQLVSGVHALHCAGLLHRDLKPSNVLVTPEGRVKIVDFGLAQLASTGRPGDGLCGTPGFIAPELMRGAAPSPASDWYSVGVMLFEALTGQRPEPPLAPDAISPDIPDGLAALARDLLAERPEARPSGQLLARRLGLPPVPAAAPVTFIGRARELAACERATARAPALLLLAGPSGTGKSALLARLAADLRDRRGALVLAGRCYEGESVPHKALDGVVDALSEHLVSCLEEPVVEILPEETRELVRLFPALARVPMLAEPAGDPPADPAEARRRALAALRRLLAALARDRPLALAVDDLQWGDADSARLLVDLLAPPDPPPVLVLATVRSDVRASSPFFRELDAQELACPTSAIVVEPMGPEDAHALAAAFVRAAAAELSDRAAERLVAAIARDSHGSPLFIETMARRLAAAGLSGHVSQDMPEEPDDTALDRALLGQLADLDPPARAALERLAVAGRPLPRSLALPGEGALAPLRARRLVRTAGDGAAVETYHDRVRQVVLRHLPPPARRAHHRALAEALAAAPAPDPDELVVHFHGAGDLARASQWAVRAADRAAQALAFARAADLYADALSWSTYPPEHVLKLMLARADALVHAGRCADAAPAYLAAAAIAPDRLQELALRGRAVEQYLVSGHVEQGLRVLRPLADELDVPFSPTTGRAVARLLLEVARLKLGRGHDRERPESAVDPIELLRVDLCWSAGKGLGFIDPVRAAALSACGLRRALACGEPRRIARGEAYLTLVDINAPDPARAAAARRTLAASRHAADRLGDPYLTGLTTILAGVAGLNNGRWRDALADVEAGAERLRERCVGVTWERAIAGAMAMHALLMLGDFPALRARADAWHREADDTGDRFAAVVAILYTGLAELAAGDPARARASVRKALSLWTYPGFSFQHWLALDVEVACDLYEGRPRAALRRVEAAWTALARSQLTRMQIPRIDARLLRANATLAVAAVDPAARPVLLRRALDDAAALRRERIDLAAAAEALILAQIAVLRRTPASPARLHDVADGFARGDMPALATAVRLSACRLSDAPADAHARELARLGVGDPTRWSATVVPVAAAESAE